MEHNATGPPAQAPGVPSEAPSSPREQLAQAISTGSATGDGSIFSQLTSNPFFTAGFGLAGLGVVLAWGQRGIRQAASLLRRRMLVDVEITRHDSAYPWFLQWMTKHLQSQLSLEVPAHERSFTSRILRRLTPGLHHLSIETRELTLPNGASRTHFSLIPGPGMHILRYRNAFIAVKRERETKSLELATGKPFETITLTTLYSFRHIFEPIFQEAHALQLRATEGKTTIYTSEMAEWKPFGQPKRKRPLESVVLAPGVKESLVSDLRSFLSGRTWYLDRGIPYRRGYLLYGPPGTGKSSFIQALAGHLDFSIAMLNLSQRGLTDDRLTFLLSSVPARTFVLLEDADAAFANRRQAAGDDGYRGANVTFSGLLNALDGVASAEERVVFLTTNRVETLDEALVRPGRVDVAVRLGEATQSQVEALWRRFYGEDAHAAPGSEPPPAGRESARAGEGDDAGAAPRRPVPRSPARGSPGDEGEPGVDELGRAFVQKLKELNLLGRVSTASLQGLFLVNKDDPAGAIRMAEALAPERRLGAEDARAAAAAAAQGQEPGEQQRREQPRGGRAEGGR